MTNNYRFIGRLVIIVAVATLFAAVSIAIWVPSGSIVSVLVPTFGFAIAITTVIVGLKLQVDTSTEVAAIRTTVREVKADTYNAVALVEQLGTTTAELQLKVDDNTATTDKTHLAVNSHLERFVAQMNAANVALQTKIDVLETALKTLIDKQAAREQGIIEGKASVKTDDDDVRQ